MLYNNQIIESAVSIGKKMKWKMELNFPPKIEHLKFKSALYGINITFLFIFDREITEHTSIQSNLDPPLVS
jgi:hypothetical protein